MANNIRNNNSTDDKASYTHNSPNPNNNAPYGHQLVSPPTIQLTNEQYERMFFQPGGPNRKHDLSVQFGNPTPLAVISFLMCITPTSCFLLGFDLTTGTSPVALIGVYYLFGGLGLFISGILEWILGNTFPFVVFCCFGGFWFNFGVLNDPAHMILGAFANGGDSADFNEGLTFYWIFWTVLVSFFFVGSLRTNACFAWIFANLFFNFAFLAAGYDKLGHGNTDMGNTYLKVAGAFGLATAAVAWYLAFGLLMSAVKMPFTVPFGDLTMLLASQEEKETILAAKNR